MADLIVFTSRQVLLPDATDPKPATIEVSRSTGKITRIVSGQAARFSYDASVDVIDAGERTILPGFVEYV